jgi:hypothetical protein
MTVGRTGTPHRFDTPVVSLKSADQTITDLKRRRQYRLAAVIDQVFALIAQEYQDRGQALPKDTTEIVHA